MSSPVTVGASRVDGRLRRVVRRVGDLEVELVVGALDLGEGDDDVVLEAAAGIGQHAGQLGADLELHLVVAAVHVGTGADLLFELVLDGGRDVGRRRPRGSAG